MGNKRAKSSDKAKKSKKTICFFALLLMAVLMCNTIPVQAALSPSVEYSVHVQDIGWMSYVKNGEVGGTTGKNLQVESIKARVKGFSGGIEYRTHQADVGWNDWARNGQESGKTGKNLQLECVQFRLTGEIAKFYNIYYRVHVQDLGWLPYVKGDGYAGSVGSNLQIEAIEIKLMPKGSSLKTGDGFIEIPTMSISAHVSDIGWMPSVSNGVLVGTTGRGKQMEAITISCEDLLGANGIKYRVYLQEKGWQEWKKSGELAGTVGENRQIEAIEIKLEGAVSLLYDVYYSTHVQDIGWLGYACNGETAGTIKGDKQVEAIYIHLVKKRMNFDRGDKAFFDFSTGSKYAQPIKLPGAKWSKSTARNAGCQHDVQAADIMNQPVYAIMDGKITCQQIVSDSYGGKLVSYGNVIKFTSLDGKVKATYAHLNGFSKCSTQVSSSYTIQKGQDECKSVRTIDLGTYSVSKGEVIGYVGTTGNSTGPHLHFELYINGVRKNPPDHVGIN